MSDVEIAKRINEAITQNGGYNSISEKTGISVSTLVRAAKGKTDPKLKDVMLISEATGISLNKLAYGEDSGSPSDRYTKEVLKGLSQISDALVAERISALEKKIVELEGK